MEVEEVATATIHPGQDIYLKRCSRCLSNRGGKDYVELSRCHHALCPECACAVFASSGGGGGANDDDGGGAARCCPFGRCGRRIDSHVYHRADGGRGAPVRHRRARSGPSIASSSRGVAGGGDDPPIAMRCNYYQGNAHAVVGEEGKTDTEVMATATATATAVEPGATAATATATAATTPAKDASEIAPALPARERLWRKRYEELKAYKEAHGDCRVLPRKAYREVYGNDVPANPRCQLGEWVQTQRALYRNLKEGRPLPRQCSSTMTTERMKLLEDIGFDECLTGGGSNDFAEAPNDDGEEQDAPEEENSPHREAGEGTEGTAAAPVIRSKHDAKWWRQFEALRQYKAEHGSANIPNGHRKTYPKLHTWVRIQRQHYVNLRRNKDSSLTKDRLAALESIGFVFVMAHDKDDLWKRRMDELRAYKAQFGDCLVPFKYPPNPALGYWVTSQRQAYSERATYLTDERIKQLEELGFVWRLRKERNSS